MDEEIKPLEAPGVHLPRGSISCSVAAVNTTCYLTVPGDTLVEPAIRGHEFMNFPTIAFLITHSPTGRRLMFDLGCRKDFWNLPSIISTTIDEKVPGIKVEKNVSDVLRDGGISLESLEAAIISHHHYDHIGDVTAFPKSMNLVVGPGFRDAFLPGYPTAQQSPVFEGAFDGRIVQELDFSNSPNVAGYHAHDYFGDGSLWILNTPGHAIGHISALVRTDSERFIFLGGDICHFGGSFRPTPYVPMPAVLHPDDLGLPLTSSSGCLCSEFLACHPENSRIKPYYRPCGREDSWYHDPPAASRSIEHLKALDANDKVFVLIAHDPAALDVLPFFPNGNLDNWYQMGWNKRLRWRFLLELPIGGRPQEFLVAGTFKDGNLVKLIKRAD